MTKFQLSKTEKSTVESRRLCTLALEIFKTLINLISNFIKDIFHFSSHGTDRKHDILHKVEILQIMVIEASELLNHIHRTLYQIVLNPLLLYLCSKILIKNWLQPKCECKLCL